MAKYWYTSPRRCSYCNSLEHDKRKCPKWSHDRTMLKSMVIAECEIYIDSLVKSKFVPTSILQLKHMDAYIFDHQEGRWCWSNTDAGDFLFYLESKSYATLLRPFRLQNSYHTRLKEWEVKPVDSLKNEGEQGATHWHKTNLSSDEIFERPPELIAARLELERCVQNNSYSVNRAEFEDLMRDLLTVYRKMIQNDQTFRLKTERVEVVSSIDEEGAREYYKGLHYKMQKNSVDNFLEEWYKHYNSKIKDNHFQK